MPDKTFSQEILKATDEWYNTEFGHIAGDDPKVIYKKYCFASGMVMMRSMMDHKLYRAVMMVKAVKGDSNYNQAEIAVILDENKNMEERVIKKYVETMSKKGK